MNRREMNRRQMLKLALKVGGGAAIGCAGFGPIVSYGAQKSAGARSLDGIGPLVGDGTGPMPISPFILSPFTDLLPIPTPEMPADPSKWAIPPDPAAHQMWMQPAAYYYLPLRVGTHSFSSSLVRRLDGTTSSLPDSTIYGFNGRFPGAMIRAFYGKPVMVRFENHLDENPLNLNRGDFGRETFLTHLHNGHTAPESDGNPNHRMEPYMPGEHCDNLYLNWPAAGDDREKQSTLWFHDHTMHDTGSNVYKGMVGFYPIYDHMDCGDETRGFRLPGFQYDIPIILYDCRLDDGITQHLGLNQDGLAHPENWGKTFFGHYPSQGFVGDVFTVNGTSQPYLPVKRRKYRLRFLDASMARWYQIKFMTGTVTAAPGTDGQYSLTGAEVAMNFTQVASEGGLLPHPIERDNFIFSPAKRKEIVVDFSRYADGSPTSNGDEIFLANTLLMTSGRKPDAIQPPGQAVPLMKFVIDGDPPVPDLSVIPDDLRELPPLPANLLELPTRRFELSRTNNMWVINGLEFDPDAPLARPRLGSAEVWTIANAGGGWVHPLHLHQEEHQVLTRNGAPPPPEDIAKEDVVALEPGEEVRIYRQFRDFTGKYVGHCHNLAHEDHNMMFGWEIIP